MSGASEKVPADEYARRYGWRKSAVVHRIRAGIYDGVKEDGTWFVLRDASRQEDPREVQGFEYVSPLLPWRTVLFPLKWVGHTFWAGVLLMFIPLLVGEIDGLTWVVGVGMVIATAPRLFEGLATGTIRALYTGPMTYSVHPVKFVVHALCYFGYAVIGLLAVIDSLGT